MNAHPENLETRIFDWDVNGVFTLTLEVETAKRGHNPAVFTDFLPYPPKPIRFAVTRDSDDKTVFETREFVFAHVRGKAAIQVEKRGEYVAVELPTNVAKALYPEEFAFAKVSQDEKIWWSFA